jgi:hypothetical protein
LCGKRVKNRETGKEYNVERVYKEWYGGWYIKALLECNGSHAVRAWENINCFEPITLRQIKESWAEMEVLQD